jgi:hypothetical protein
MKTQYTPGPWKVVHTPTRKETFWAICTTNEAPHQAVIALVDGKSKYHEEHPECAEANARLIASAPDLLAALEQLTQAVEVEGFAGVIPSAIDAARAAINKATGGDK